jgi:hypothetical protein
MRELELRAKDHLNTQAGQEINELRLFIYYCSYIYDNNYILVSYYLLRPCTLPLHHNYKNHKPNIRFCRNKGFN